jgi:hypothetical protein
VPGNANVNSHVSSQLDELVAASLLSLPRAFVPKGGYEKRLHDLKRPLSPTNHFIAKHVHRFADELIVYV